MKIAYQGEPGAFSEAASRLVSADATLVPCKSFEEVFAAVEQGPAQYGVLPIENSIGGSIHRNYDLLMENHLPIVGRGRSAGRASSAGASGRGADGDQARLLASAGAGAVRTVSADAVRGRDHRDLRHGRQREDGGRRQADRHGGDRVGARRRDLRPHAARVVHSGFQRQHHALHRHRPASAVGRRARQDDDRVLAAERAGLAVQGAERVRAARRGPDEARVAPDSGPAVGIPLLCRPGGGARRDCRASERSAHLAEFAPVLRTLGSYTGWKGQPS